MDITKSIPIDPSSMSNLPPEMIITILQNLTPPDLKSVRQVSHRFRDLVDSAISFPVTIDDNQPGNIRFVRRIVKSEAKICSLGTKTSLTPARKPQMLKKLAIICRIPPTFFSTDIMVFNNLQTLVLGGDAMLKKIPLAKSIYLPNLTRLELNSAFYGENEPRGSLNTLKNTVAVAMNTLGFLTSIDCPAIQELTLDGDVDQGRTLLDEKLDWKQEPLTKFIEKYQKTLNKIIIGESSILKSFETTRECPCSSLNHLHISFFGNERGRNFWANFAGSQRQLEVLNLGALWYQSSHQLFEKLPKTIVNLTLYWNLSQSQALDARIFAGFANLERLELTFDGTWGSFQYLTQFELLKSCSKLMVLVFEQILIPARDLEKITELFPRLRVCFLYLIGDPNSNVDVDAGPFGITEIALKKLISASTKDSLSHLYLCTEDFLGDERIKNQMVNELSTVGYRKVNYKGYFIGTEPENLKDNYNTTV